jgi:hypothetical protein
MSNLSTAPDGYLARREVLSRIGRSPEWLRAACLTGKFPLGRLFGNRRVWLQSEIDDFLANLPAPIPGGRAHVR